MFRTNSLIFISFLCVALATGPAVAQQEPVAEALNARLEELQFAGDLDIGGAQIAAREVLPATYANRDFQPMWTDGARIEEFLSLLETAPADGLDVDDYFVSQIRAQMAEARDSAIRMLGEHAHGLVD